MSATIRLLFFVSFLIYSGQSGAQDFIIDHDLQNDKTRYFKVSNQRDTVKVKGIATKKQAHISLNIENFNPFYWNAKVTAIKKPVEEQSSNAGVFNPFSFLGKGLGGLVKDIIPDLDLGKIGSRGGGREPAEVNSKYLYHAAAYQKLYIRYQSLTEHAEDMKLLKLYLNELKFDIKKTGTEIKKEAKEAVTKIIGNVDLTRENALSTGRKLNKEVANISDSLLSEKKNLDELKPDIDQDTEADGLTLGEISDKIDNSSKRLFLNSFVVNETNFVNDLIDIADIYQEIQNARYKFSYTINGATDISELKLQLFPLADSLGRDTITKYFSVQSKGNIKIRNSIGISFTHFADKNKSYYITPDTAIASSDADLFTPVLSTFINFYPYTGSSLKLGGSIGFGIPVTGERKDINYMLGVSAFIGKNEPIIITAGVAGTNVNKLANGLKTGDKVSRPDFIIPKISVFRAGIFLSISFNLSSFSTTK